MQPVLQVALSLAATHASPEQTARLREITSTMSQTADPAELFEFDADLHHTVAEATANLVLQSLLNYLRTLLSCCVRQGG